MSTDQTTVNYKQDMIIFTIIATFILIFGHNFILQKSETSPSQYLSINGGDAVHYINIIESGTDGIRAPFKFRVLVTTLARLLPFNAADSLRVITYFSIFIMNFLLLLICRRLSLPIVASVLGLGFSLTFQWQLYNFHNPYLTDAFGQMILTILIYALISKNLYLYASTIIVGVLAREATVFLVPVWHVRDYKQGAMLTLLALVVMLIPRILLAAESDASLIDAFTTHGKTHLASMPTLLREMLHSWRFGWLIIVTGLCFFDAERFKYLAAAFSLLLCGAVLSTFFAADIGRMFSILIPIATITFAKYTEAIVSQRRYWVLIFLACLALIQLVTVMPNIIIGEELHTGLKSIKRIIAVSGWVVCFVVMVINRRVLLENLLNGIKRYQWFPFNGRK